MSSCCSENKQAGANATQENARQWVTPRFTVQEKPDEYSVRVELPGVDKSRLNLTVEADKVTIEGTRGWTVPEDWTPLHEETADGGFKLVIATNNGVNPDAVKAELAHGVLNLHLGKAEALKARRVDIAG